MTQLLDKEGIDVNKEDIYVNCQISEKILGEDKKSSRSKRKRSRDN